MAKAKGDRCYRGLHRQVARGSTEERSASQEDFIDLFVGFEVDGRRRVDGTASCLTLLW